MNSLVESIKPKGHRWKFYRAGGVDQVSFRNGSDILSLEQLDQKLWVALACPTKGLEFDSRTLELIDIDKDARIRVPEILSAINWIKQVFKTADDLLKGSDSLPLSAIQDDNPVGAAVLAGARRILTNLGKADSPVISLADVTDTTRIFASTQFNGDGIVPPDTAADPEVRKVLEEIIVVTGGLLDRSGKLGVNQAMLDGFFAESAALCAWHAQATTEPSILPLGDKTAAASAALAEVRAKIDDFFARCQFAAFDPRSAGPLNRAESEFLLLASKDLSLCGEEIAKFPLAHVAAGRSLPLEEGINPGWTRRIKAFRENCIQPLANNIPEFLSFEDWKSLLSRFAPFEKWIASKPATAVEKLGIARLNQILQSGSKEKIAALIHTDLALQAELDQITSVEKLIRIQRDFFRLLNNFVSFTDFYSRRGAIFQAGTLYLDARSCDLCVYVNDAARHAALAGMAKAYLAYCDCTRTGGLKMTIAVAFTAGDSDHLMPGRNGVFYDRKGLDWDATITKVIENPISIRQAFWAPYKKFVRMVEEQVAKRAAAADAAAQGKLSSLATDVVTIDQKAPLPAAPAKPLEQKKVDVGTVAALGVALGSIGTFLGVMFTKFVDLRWWAPVALLGLILAISGPSMLIAWLKLRQRNLGPILDANGWAINGRMKINVPFGGSLSKTPKLPLNSELELTNLFVEDHSQRNAVIALLVVGVILLIFWRLGWLAPLFR